MKYFLFFERPHAQLIRVAIKLNVDKGKQVFLLPTWRPGRYELQDYVSRIADVRAVDENGQPLPIQKQHTHGWTLEVAIAGEVTLEYNYYANQPDAGGSYFDHSIIYINPINLLFYQQERVEEACTLQLDLPDNYQIGGSLTQTPSTGSYAFSSFHELVDTPILASASLIHQVFHVQNIPFHLWFAGDCKPDLNQMVHDFTLYTEAQLQLFGDFPVEEYHYLCLMLPYPYRHGVEHYASTVIAMGPGMHLMKKPFYRSFLEICSHELFHTWNVKNIRPEDMLPYKYGQENYSTLHYITEGVTTYYGDLMLWKGGNWTFEDWISNVNGDLKRHYGMGGKDFISLEAASFDSWVNGYKSSGIPNRRISFYTKGCIVALLTDLRLRQATGHGASLDQVMRKMYERFGKLNNGYTQADYQGLLEELSGTPWNSFFQHYIAGITELLPLLQEFADFMGLTLVPHPLDQLGESWWGMKVRPNARGETLVQNILPNCPAEAGGISQGDILVAVNGRKIEKNWEEWLTYLSEETEFTLHYFHQGILRESQLRKEEQTTYSYPQLIPNYAPSPVHLQNRELWRQVPTD